MGLFGISRELQFRVCNQGESCASSPRAREGYLYSGEKEVGRVTVNRVHGFSWLSPCRARRGVLLLSVRLCYYFKGMTALPSGLPILCNWGFCLLIVYAFHLVPNWSSSPREIQALTHHQPPPSSQTVLIPQGETTLAARKNTHNTALLACYRINDFLFINFPSEATCEFLTVWFWKYHRFLGCWTLAPPNIEGVRNIGPFN